MEKYISKDALVAEIERRKEEEISYDEDSKSFASYADETYYSCLNSIQDFINTLEVRDPYEQRIQYSSVKDGIKAHAEVYSFNIESKLFNQLTKEQQELWRKEIEQAYINGGDAGVELTRDTRYNENLEVKEVDLEKELDSLIIPELKKYKALPSLMDVAKHFFELGMAASNKAQKE